MIFARRSRRHRKKPDSTQNRQRDHGKRWMVVTMRFGNRTASGAIAKVSARSPWQRPAAPIRRTPTPANGRSARHARQSMPMAGVLHFEPLPGQRRTKQRSPLRAPRFDRNQRAKNGDYRRQTKQRGGETEHRPAIRALCIWLKTGHNEKRTRSLAAARRQPTLIILVSRSVGLADFSDNRVPVRIKADGEQDDTRVGLVVYA